MATPGAAPPQRTEGEGREPAHPHSVTAHTHDHYHATHHRGGPLGEWAPRTAWHTHARTHAPLTHRHDSRREDEARDHAEAAHARDHPAPA
jgi:hypothetical protein